MNRWTVRTHQSHRNGSKCPKSRWVVDPPGFDYKRRAEHTGNWHRAGGKWFQWGAAFTKREAWEAALAYADHMARTVQVEIPREPHRAGRHTLRSHQAGIQIRYKKWPKKRGEMTIAHTDVKDLALALLAHHYRAVDNPQ